MSSRIREGLAGLEQDVAGLRLAPPAAVRARGRAHARRRAVALTGAVVAMAATGTALLPALIDGRLAEGPAGQVAAGQQPASASPSCTPDAAPPKDPDPLLDRALARSRTMMVFLGPTTTAEQRTHIGNALRGMKGVTGVGFRDHAQQWRHFRDTYTGVCGGADLIAAVRPEQFPEAFAVTLGDPDDYPAVEDLVRALPGVDEVVHTFG